MATLMNTFNFNINDVIIDSMSNAAYIKLQVATNSSKFNIKDNEINQQYVWQHGKKTNILVPPPEERDYLRLTLTTGQEIDGYFCNTHWKFRAYSHGNPKELTKFALMYLNIHNFVESWEFMPF